MNVDPHEVLGVARDATAEEIRAVYSRLVRRHHPDRHANAPADVRERHAARMAEVTGAFRLLRNPDALARHRAARARAAGASDGESPTRGASDPAGGRAGTNRGGGPGTDRAGRDEEATGSTFDYRRAAASEFTTSAEKPARGRRSKATGRRAAKASRRARGRGRGGGRLVWAALVVVLVGILAWWLTATPEGLELLDSVVGRGRAAWNAVV